ncbi:hypothetical protein DSM112329_03216 [Paraconexibacter sp. AEG42_29]|uniref:CD-NTase-associated protein 15 domain-containing protein n=1 Tax=Paraconexibacter sp. AEG42_29 TaxID=2997339 RepID=A0AAU7AYF1_9ACTN
MPTSTWTRAVLVLGALLWFGALWVLGETFNATWLKPAGGVLAAVVGLLWLFDRFVWRRVPAKVRQRPDVRGTWATDLHYTDRDSQAKVKRCYLVVRQTFAKVSVRMYFDISSSDSERAAILSEDDTYRLAWDYRSAATEYDHENPSHRGKAEMKIATVPALELDGTYWTERKTTGRLVTVGWSKELFDSFSAADAAEYGPKAK